MGLVFIPISFRLPEHLLHVLFVLCEHFFVTFWKKNWAYSSDVALIINSTILPFLSFLSFVFMSLSLCLYVCICRIPTGECGRYHGQYTSA